MMNKEEIKKELEAYQRGYMAHVYRNDAWFDDNKNAVLDRLERDGRIIQKNSMFNNEPYTYREVSKSLQWEIRQGEPPKSLEDCVTATLEALVLQGSINAWDGDGVSCVAQMIWAMHRRAEKAEQELKNIKTEKP